MFRSTKNKGAFAALPERMSKKHIRQLAREYNISLRGIRIVIDFDEEKLKESFNYAGRADEFTVGRIDFFPKAFTSKEDLLRTLYHERLHVLQYKKYGVTYVLEHSKDFEDITEAEENNYINDLKKRGLL